MNGNIKAAFGPSSTVFALGELGGSYDASGLGSETVNSSVTMQVDPSLLTGSARLKLGLYQGAIKGQGCDSLSLDIDINGADFFSKSFASATAARTYFTNNVLDLGAVSRLSGGNPFDLKISLSETISQANSGFFGDLIVGNAPSSGGAPRARTMSASFAATPASGSPAEKGVPGPCPLRRCFRRMRDTRCRYPNRRRSPDGCNARRSRRREGSDVLMRAPAGLAATRWLWRRGSQPSNNTAIGNRPSCFP